MFITAQYQVNQSIESGTGQFYVSLTILLFWSELFGTVMENHIHIQSGRIGNITYYRRKYIFPDSKLVVGAYYLSAYHSIWF